MVRCCNKQIQSRNCLYLEPQVHGHLPHWEHTFCFRKFICFEKLSTDACIHCSSRYASYSEYVFKMVQPNNGVVAVWLCGSERTRLWFWACHYSKPFNIPNNNSPNNNVIYVSYVPSAVPPANIHTNTCNNNNNNNNKIGRQWL